MRLDQYLVAEGLAPSRARAQALIAAGAVTLDGQVVRRPARPVGADAAVVVAPDPNPWVSRAGLKLDHALSVFAMTPHGVALDLGASTGGFTEVLLARGATRVHALDVGHGQLAPRLRSDPRVVLHEGVNARAIPPGLIGSVDWITADLSFISLKLVLPGVLELARPGAGLVALIKPQFECGPAGPGKGGVVRDQALQRAACAGVAALLAAASWQVTGTIESPIRGGDGNREFLIAAVAPG